MTIHSDGGRSVGPGNRAHPSRGDFPLEELRPRWQARPDVTLVATEFLRRFFLHVLPKGFVRIRHFGFLANRSRASSLVLCRQLLASNSSAPAEIGTCQIPSESSTLWHCPRCGAAMIVMQRFTAVELSTCAYFDSSQRFPQSRLADVRLHAHPSVRQTTQNRCRRGASWTIITGTHGPHVWHKTWSL
jgi:hypothetical protein